jgi:hypothetical protein
MANKTPPLVIPVVIDSTGVDKGLSNVGSRLRRGVSGTGAGGGAGGGGFGTGGALAAAALGAGVAAAAGRRKDIKQEVKGILERQNLDEMRSFTNKLRSKSAVYDTKFKMMNAERRYTHRQNVFNADPTLEGLMGLQEARQAKISRTAEHNRQVRLNRFRDGRNRFVNDMKSLPSLGIGGISVAATATAGMRFAENFRQNTSDISNLQGSPLYGMLRNVQRRNNMAPPQPTKLQGFLAGGLMLSGGQQTAIEKDVGTVMSGSNDIMTSLGMAYQFMRTNSITESGKMFLKGLGL